MPLKVLDKSDVYDVCSYSSVHSNNTFIFLDIVWAVLVYCPLLFMCSVSSVKPMGSEREGQGSLFWALGQKFKIVKV